MCECAQFHILRLFVSALVVFGLVGIGASFLSFVPVNIDVNYLVSKQIRCMQSH